MKTELDIRRLPSKAAAWLAQMALMLPLQASCSRTAPLPLEDGPSGQRLSVQAGPKQKPTASIALPYNPADDDPPPRVTTNSASGGTGDFGSAPPDREMLDAVVTSEPAGTQPMPPPPVAAEPAGMMPPPVNTEPGTSVPGTSVPDAPPTTAPCRLFGEPTQLSQVAPTQLNEISGLAYSRQYDGRLYVHNDSGDGPIVYALTTGGELVTAYELAGPTLTNLDWEDIALGPGPSAGDWLYVGDIGDNLARELPDDPSMWRTDIVVYRLPEPAPSTEASVRLKDVQELRFTYPGISHDAEGLALDPLTGELYILSKEADGNSSVYVARDPSVGTQVLEFVTLLPVAQLGTPFDRGMITALDIHPQGEAWLVRTYESILQWPRSSDGSWLKALSERPEIIRAQSELQGEAISYGPDGETFVTVSEGVNAPLWHYTACP